MDGDKERNPQGREYHFGREVTVNLTEPTNPDLKVMEWLATWDDQHYVTVVAGSDVIKLFALMEDGGAKIGNYSVQGARKYALVLLSAADYAENGNNDE